MFLLMVFCLIIICFAITTKLEALEGVWIYAKVLLFSIDTLPRALFSTWRSFLFSNLSRTF